jgi:hypothetical protein
MHSASPKEDAAALDHVDEPEHARDMRFNPYRFPNSGRAFDVVRDVAHEIEQGAARKRAPTEQARRVLDNTLARLVSNLIYHHLSGRPGTGVAVPRSKKLLAGARNRYQPFSFPRTFPKLLDILQSREVIEQTTGAFSGFPGRSKLTTIRAGAKLVEFIDYRGVTFDDLRVSEDEEVIILKRSKGYWNENAPRIDYRDNRTTHRYRAELRAINAWLERADIRFDPGAYDLPVDVRARRLYRYFSNASFESGGRLYGGFWINLPKEVRLRGITIEGEPVVGLDYGLLNPRLAYKLARAAPPPLDEDAYMLPGLEEHREGVKKVFNAMLFGYAVKQFPTGMRALFPKRTKITDITGAILKRHPALKGVLASPESGHRLMFLESEIMMAVLRNCLEHGIVALPVFDCVVVPGPASVAVERMMQSAFRTIAGFEGTVRWEA